MWRRKMTIKRVKLQTDKSKQFLNNLSKLDIFISEMKFNRPNPFWKRLFVPNPDITLELTIKIPAYTKEGKSNHKKLFEIAEVF